MSGSFFWQDVAVTYHDGESVASALDRAGIRWFGTNPAGQDHSVFCGIGQCQSCLILHEGRLSEACLLPARDGMRLGTLEEGGADE